MGPGLGSGGDDSVVLVVGLVVVDFAVVVAVAVVVAFADAVAAIVVGLCACMYRTRYLNGVWLFLPHCVIFECRFRL